MVHRHVRGQHGVVRLNHAGADVWRRVNGHLQLALLGKVIGQLLCQQRREPRTGSTAKRMEHEEPLQTIGLFSHPSDYIHGISHQLLPYVEVTPSKIVRRVLLATDQIIRMEQASERTGLHLIDYRRFRVDQNGSRNIAIRYSSLEERAAEAVTVVGAVRFLLLQFAILADLVLQAIEFPSRISQLDSGLADVNGNGFAVAEALRTEMINGFGDGLTGPDDLPLLKFSFL